MEKMTQKQLRKLNRIDLLEMLIEESKLNRKLQDDIKALNEKLENKEILIQNAGTMAEAALKLSGTFEAADMAAEQYLYNVKRLYDGILENVTDEVDFSEFLHSQIHQPQDSSNQPELEPALTQVKEENDEKSETLQGDGSQEDIEEREEEFEDISDDEEMKKYEEWLKEEEELLRQDSIEEQLLELKLYIKTPSQDLKLYRTEKVSMGTKMLLRVKCDRGQECPKEYSDQFVVVNGAIYDSYYEDRKFGEMGLERLYTFHILQDTSITLSAKIDDIQVEVETCEESLFEDAMLEENVEETYLFESDLEEEFEEDLEEEFEEDLEEEFEEDLKEEFEEDLKEEFEEDLEEEFEDDLEENVRLKSGVKHSAKEAQRRLEQEKQRVLYEEELKRLEEERRLEKERELQRALAQEEKRQLEEERRQNLQKTWEKRRLEEKRRRRSIAEERKRAYEEEQERLRLEEERRRAYEEEQERLRLEEERRRAYEEEQERLRLEEERKRAYEEEQERLRLEEERKRAYEAEKERLHLEAEKRKSDEEDKKRRTLIQLREKAKLAEQRRRKEALEQKKKIEEESRQKSLHERQELERLLEEEQQREKLEQESKMQIALEKEERELVRLLEKVRELQELEKSRETSSIDKKVSNVVPINRLDKDGYYNLNEQSSFEDLDEEEESLSHYLKLVKTPQETDAVEKPKKVVSETEIKRGEENKPKRIKRTPKDPDNNDPTAGRRKRRPIKK